MNCRSLLKSYMDAFNNDPGCFVGDMPKFFKSSAEHIDRISDPSFRTDSYIIKEERDSLYIGSLPVSLDILKLKRLFPKEIYMIKKSGERKICKGDIFNKIENENLYTDAIINVTFDKALYDLELSDEGFDIWKTKHVRKGKKTMETRDLRQKIYDEGVSLRFGDLKVEYVKYKRSASKAREGSHLFIKKELEKEMNDWGKFGINYDDSDKNVPLVAIKAYESLTSSGIEKIVKICPNEILLIDDVVKEVEIKASVTTESENGEIIAEDDDKYLIKNIIWDGQSLADTSLFDNSESKEQKGMMLLRNSFFKSCAFNTNIQKWFDDKCGDNKKEVILDKFGREVKRTDIKLITTPSSLKFLKFYDKFSGVDKCEKEKNCYEKWLATISDEFGVCKHEKASPFGEFHQLSYQIVNSLPLSKDEVGVLLEDELKHIGKMKNDVNYFKDIIKGVINSKNHSSSDALMLMLLNVNNKMWYTEMVKEYVKDKVDNYITNLRKGHIKVKGSDYAVLFGNPLEMLQYAIEGEIKEYDYRVASVN